jgi:hypothetical protein
MLAGYRVAARGARNGAIIRRATRIVEQPRCGRGFLIVLVGVLLGMGWLPASAPAQTYPAEPLVPATPARAFGDSVGVGVRLNWTDTAYADFATIESRLLELGVRHVGDGLCSTCEEQIRRIRALAAHGIRHALGVSELTQSVAKMQQGLNVVRDQLRGAVDMIDGPNETDISGDPNWIADTRAYQAELYRRVKSDAALASLPVVGPTVVHGDSHALVGDLSASLDFGNIHPYPGGTMPLSNLDDVKQLAAHMSGTKGLVATEVGYHNYLAEPGAHRPASEWAAAIYTPRLLLEAFRGGVVRSYLFQLLDPWSQAQMQQKGLPGRENAFGLLRTDLSRKPAFITVRNLLRTVDAGSAPVASPGGLRYGLEGASPDLRQLLLRSADGSFRLVLWRQVSVWDPWALKDLSPAPQHVEVVLGEPVALAQRFDPVMSDGETARVANPTRIPVDLAGAPVVLRLIPPGAPPARQRQDERTPSPKDASRTNRRQRLGRFVVIKVSCRARCVTVSGRGKLVVTRKGAKRGRSFPLRPRRARVKRGHATLRLPVPVRARRAAARALRRGGRVRAKVTVRGHTRGGARVSAVKLKVALP